MAVLVLLTCVVVFVTILEPGYEWVPVEPLPKWFWIQGVSV